MSQNQPRSKAKQLADEAVDRSSSKQTSSILRRLIPDIENRELSPVESTRLTESISPAGNTSLAPNETLALRDESLVESISLVENTSLADSTVDFWAALKEWKEGFQQIPNMVALVLYRHLDPAERAVYGELFQLSWGFGNSSCKVSLPRLSERSGMKETATHKAVQRLVGMGLVQKSKMDFGKGKEQGITYSLPLPARLVESIRLTRSTRLADSTNNKLKALKENNKRESAPPDYKLCPDCQGSGFYYPEGVEKGVAKCKHERLSPCSPGKGTVG